MANTGKVQSGSSIAQNFASEAEKAKKTILSSRAVPPLKLDNKELGFVKQPKELQKKHHISLVQHEKLKDSKSRAVDQLNSAREVNKGASQVIADLEGEIKNLGQDKLGLELKQVKLEKEVETLKRKRRSTPSPPTAKSAPTPTLRILKRGEKESPAAMESTLSLLPLFSHLKRLGTGRKDGTNRHQDRKRKRQAPHALLTT